MSSSIDLFNMTVLVWNGMAICSKNPKTRGPRLRFFFKQAMGGLIMGGLEAHARQSIEPTLNEEFSKNKMVGGWSHHFTGWYGVLVALRPERLPLGAIAHFFEIGPGMVAALAFGKCSNGPIPLHRRWFTSARHPGEAMTYEEFSQYEPHNAYTYIVIYAYITSAGDSIQKPQLLSLNAHLKETEERFPNTIIIMQGDWNLALTKCDTLHVKDDIVCGKASLSPNASLFRKLFLPRYAEVFQDEDTLRAKTRTYTGRNDRFYIKFAPGTQLLWEVQAQAMELPPKNPVTNTRYSDHRPLRLKFQKPVGLFRPVLPPSCTRVHKWEERVTDLFYKCYQGPSDIYLGVLALHASMWAIHKRANEFGEPRGMCQTKEESFKVTASIYRLLVDGPPEEHRPRCLYFKRVTALRALCPHLSRIVKVRFALPGWRFSAAFSPKELGKRLLTAFEEMILAEERDIEIEESRSKNINHYRRDKLKQRAQRRLVGRAWSYGAIRGEDSNHITFGGRQVADKLVTYWGDQMSSKPSAGRREIDSFVKGWTGKWVILVA